MSKWIHFQVAAVFAPMITYVKYSNWQSDNTV